MILTSLAMAAAQVPQSVELSPTTKWTVSYNDSDCTLTRTFGDTVSPTVFGFKPGPTMKNGDIILVVPAGRATDGSSGQGKIRLMPSGETVEMRWMSAAMGDGRHGVRFWADDPTFWDKLAQADAITLEFGSSPPISLQVGAMHKAVAGLRTCGDNLLHHWGVDPTALALPDEDKTPGSWFNNNDYPASVRRKGREGRVGMVMTFDRAGTPASCKVVNSSAIEELDKISCAVATKRGKVPPATPDQKDVRFLYLAVRWQLW